MSFNFGFAHLKLHKVEHIDRYVWCNILYENLYPTWYLTCIMKRRAHISTCSTLCVHAQYCKIYIYKMKILVSKTHLALPLDIYNIAVACGKELGANKSWSKSWRWQLCLLKKKKILVEILMLFPILWITLIYLLCLFYQSIRFNNKGNCFLDA